ncbi:MAG: hypothetical protein WAP55_02020 [Minisyncoccia bacterium]
MRQSWQDYRETAERGPMAIAVKVILAVFVLSSLMGMSAIAETSVAYYVDSRSFNSATVQASTGGLPLGISAWGFVDLHGNKNSRADASRMFVESRLIRTVWRNASMHVEYNDAHGIGNSMLRYGIAFNPRFAFHTRPGWLLVRFSPYETDGSGQQVTIAWSVPLLTRVALGGFSDWNIQSHGRNKWVIEPEIAFGLNERITLVIEPRYNGFQKAERFGMAFGSKVQF